MNSTSLNTDPAKVTYKKLLFEKLTFINLLFFSKEAYKKLESLIFPY